MSRRKWQKPKTETKVVITEQALEPASLNFPRNQTLSPFDKFWQEHRHEEKDDKKRRQMDKTMEKYV